MKRFIEEMSRAQVSLLLECLDDFVAKDNPIREVGAFVEQLDLVALEFDRVTPTATGRLSYHPRSIVEDLNLRLSQPHSIQPTSGARMPA